MSPAWTYIKPGVRYKDFHGVRFWQHLQEWPDGSHSWWHGKDDIRS